MNLSGDTLSWIVAGGLLMAIFAACGFVIKRFFIDKKYFGGYQFIGRQIYEKFQNADGRQATEQVIYMEEEERHQDFTTDDKDADRKNAESENDKGKGKNHVRPDGTNSQ